MTVKELTDLLRNAPDEMQVLISVTGEFDGRFTSPCIAESGVGELGIGEEEESGEDEVKKFFLIVPHGFFELKEADHLRDYN